MNPSEKFLRFAAECEFMAKFTHNPENKTVRSRMAERWLRCAEFFESQNSAAHRSSSAKHHRKPTLTVGLPETWRSRGYLCQVSPDARQDVAYELAVVSQFEFFEP